MSQDFAKHLDIIWNHQLRISSWTAPRAEAAWPLFSEWRLTVGFFPSYPSSFYLSPKQMLIPNKVILRLLHMVTYLLYCTLMRNFEGGNMLFWFVLCCNWAARPIWWKLNISSSEASRSCEESTAAFGGMGVGVRMEGRCLFWINLASN